jgi:hypothetical protein
VTQGSAVSLPLYSPLPPEFYSRPCTVGRAGIGYELRAESARPLWNLYWLSEPRLDEFLRGGPTGLLDLKLFGACKRSLVQELDGEPVAQQTIKQPAVFVATLLRSPHKHLEPYKLLGVQWVRTVSARSRLCRGVQKEEGTVAFVNFGGKPAVVTSARESAIIMTLALKKN